MYRPAPVVDHCPRWCNGEVISTGCDHSIARADRNPRGITSDGTAPKRLCKGVRARERYDHVVIVVMENKKWSTS